MLAGRAQSRGIDLSGLSRLRGRASAMWTGFRILPARFISNRACCATSWVDSLEAVEQAAPGHAEQPLAKAALAGIAAMLVKRVLGGR